MPRPRRHVDQIVHREFEYFIADEARSATFDGNDQVGMFMFFKTRVATSIDFEVTNLHAIAGSFSEESPPGDIFECGRAIFVFVDQFLDIAPTVWLVLDHVEFVVAHEITICLSSHTSPPVEPRFA